MTAEFYRFIANALNKGGKAIQELAEGHRAGPIVGGELQCVLCAQQVCCIVTDIGIVDCEVERTLRRGHECNEIENLGSGQPRHDTTSSQGPS